MLQTAVLIFTPDTAVQGLVFWGQENRTTVCNCESPLTGVVDNQLGSNFVVVAEESPDFNGTSDVEVNLHFFTNESYDDVVPSGQDVPSQERMFWQLNSTTGHAIRIESCLASPSSSFDTSVDLLADGCSKEPFAVEGIEGSLPHVVRFSTRSFKFTGTTNVFVRCQWTQCKEEPCGICGGRRLQTSDGTQHGKGSIDVGRRLQQTSDEHIRVPLNSAVVVLPGLPEVVEQLLPMHTGDEHATPWTLNTTFYGQMTTSSVFLEAMVDACATWMTAALMQPARVINVFAPRPGGGSSRRLRGTFGVVEMLVLEYALDVPFKEHRAFLADKMVKANSNGMSDVFVNYVLEELRGSNVSLPNHLFASFEADVPLPTPPEAPVKTGILPGMRSSWLNFLAGMLVSCFLCGIFNLMCCVRARPPSPDLPSAEESGDGDTKFGAPCPHAYAHQCQFDQKLAHSPVASPVAVTATHIDLASRFQTL